MYFKEPHALAYQTEHAAGFDIPCSIDFTLQPGEFKGIPTNLFLDVERNLNESITDELQLRSRSGLAIKHGVAVLNSPATIDADYQGEIKVILINHGPNPVAFKAGDRIAQGVVAAKRLAHGVPVKDAKRSGGFGSTGVWVL